jgi:hypothetical protein
MSRGAVEDGAQDGAQDGGQDGAQDAAERPDPREVRRRIARGVLLAVGAVALQWALQGAGPLPAVPVALGGAAVALVALPGLLPRGALRLARGLPSLVVVRAILSGTYFGAETFVPLMLVSERRVTPALAGLTLTAGALGWSSASWLQGRPGLRVTRTTLLSLGGLVVGVCVLLLAPTPFPAVPWWSVAAVWIVSGFGMGLGMSSTSVLTLRLSAPGEEGRNSSGLQIGDSLGSILGIGGAGAVFSLLHDPGGSDAGVFALIWVLLGSVGVLSALVALRVRRPA